MIDDHGPARATRRIFGARLLTCTGRRRARHCVGSPRIWGSRGVQALDPDPTSPSARASRTAADAELADRIRTIHDQDRAWGAPRITAELNDGEPACDRVNQKRVACVMRGHAIAGLRLRRRVRTTIPSLPSRRCLTCWAGTSPPPRPTSATSGTSPICRSRMGRKPVPGHGDRLLLPTADRVGDRRAHAHRPGHRRARNRPGHTGFAGGAIFHSDHGAQNSAKIFAQLCARLGVTRSMSAVGTSLRLSPG